MTNVKKNEDAETDASYRALDADEKAHLHLWASATPAQRLAWREEAMQLAAKSGALSPDGRKL